MSKPLHSLAAAALLLAAAALPFAVHAKLPAPSPEAKAKADEAKAKGDHGNKVAAYRLCLSMDRAAAHYYKTVGTGARAATPTAPCADPGPFVATPPAAAGAAAPAAPAAPAVAAAPAAPAAPAAKK